MTDWRSEIARRADNIEESVVLSSVQHFILGKMLRRLHLIMGIAATTAATASTGLIFYQSALQWPGFISLGIAILTALMTFLNPKEAADSHHDKGVNYQELAYDANLLARVYSRSEKTESKLAARLEELKRRKFAIDRQKPATPGGMLYKAAKASIARGETSFRTDSTDQAAPE